jgi:hypothetical protein
VPSGGEGSIDGAMREIAPERIDEAALESASLGAQRLSTGGIADGFSVAGVGPKSAGLADDLPGLSIAANRIAPANPARLNRAAQHETAFGIEDGDKLRRQPQIRVTIRSDVARGDARHDLRHGGREGAEGAQLDLAFDLHLIQRRIIPMREAEAADAKRQAIRQAQMGKGVADQDVTRRANGGLGQRQVHRDNSATGGWSLSPTLKPVTNSPTQLFLLSGIRP